MLRLVGRRKAEVSPSSVGIDRVLMGISLPSDTVIHGISFQGGTTVDQPSTELATNVVTQYALEAWVLPIDDPDATADFDDVWDTLVPKDTDVQTLDLDAESVDTAIFYEPGEADWGAVFDVGIRPMRLWHHRNTLSVMNTKGVKFVDSQTPFEPKWQPGDTFSYQRREPIKISQPSVFLIGCGVPAGDDTTNVVELPLGENEWPRVKYLGDTLILALQEVLGLTEAGAETPWEEAADLLQRHLDPDVMETDASFYLGTIMRFFGEMVVDHSVVGTLSIKTVDTGR